MNAFEAVLAGNRTALIKALDAGASPNAVDEKDRSLARLALANQRLDCLEELLIRGVGGSGPIVSLLHECSILGFGKCSAMLAKAFPEQVNRLDISGRSPLHWACEGLKAEVVRALLEAGAKPDLPDSEGERALMMLGRVSRRDEALAMACVEMLEQSGADLMVKNANGERVWENERVSETMGKWLSARAEGAEISKTVGKVDGRGMAGKKASI